GRRRGRIGAPGRLVARQRPPPALGRDGAPLTLPPRPGLHCTHGPHTRQRDLPGRRFRSLARPARAAGGEDGTRGNEPGGIPGRIRTRRRPLPPLPGRPGTGRAARPPAHRPRDPGKGRTVPRPRRWRVLTRAETAPPPAWPTRARAWPPPWRRRWMGWK